MVKLISNKDTGTSEAVINGCLSLPGDIEAIEIPFGKLFVRLNFKAIEGAESRLSIGEIEGNTYIVDVVNIESPTGTAFDVPLPVDGGEAVWSLSVLLSGIPTKTKNFMPRSLIYSFIKRVDK